MRRKLKLAKAIMDAVESAKTAGVQHPIRIVLSTIRAYGSWKRFTAENYITESTESVKIIIDKASTEAYLDRKSPGRR